MRPQLKQFPPKFIRFNVTLIVVIEVHVQFISHQNFICCFFLKQEKKKKKILVIRKVYNFLLLQHFSHFERWMMNFTTFWVHDRFMKDFFGALVLVGLGLETDVFVRRT